MPSKKLSVTAHPRRVQLSRKKGWHLPDNTIVVSRPTRWGNPYKARTPEERGEAVARYRTYIEGPKGRTLRAEAVKTLRGHNLACWCPLGGPCHANILLAIANA